MSVKFAFSPRYVQCGVCAIAHFNDECDASDDDDDDRHDDDDIDDDEDDNDDEEMMQSFTALGACCCWTFVGFSQNVGTVPGRRRGGGERLSRRPAQSICSFCSLQLFAK